MPKKSRHPLEGKYVVMRYGEGDRYAEAWVIALHRFVGGRVREIVGYPSNGPQNWDVDGHNEKVVRLLVEKRVREVATVLASGKGYRGLETGVTAWDAPPLDDCELAELSEEEIEEAGKKNWCESQPVGILYGEHEKGLLEGAGIRVRPFDAATETFPDEAPPEPVPEGPRHVLEGKLGLFAYAEHGWCNTGSTLVLGRFVRDGFEEIVGAPLNGPDNWMDGARGRAERILEAMKETGEKEVVTVALGAVAEEEFLGVPTRRHSWSKEISAEDRADLVRDLGDRPDLLRRTLEDYWVEHRAVDAKDPGVQALREAGVALRSFDPSTGEFSDGTAE